MPRWEGAAGSARGMNLPNALTLLRIFFVPLVVAALVADGDTLTVGPFAMRYPLVALAIFLMAALTDLLDGYLARRWRQTTTVGTLLDPIADKLLVSAALIALVEARQIPAWIVVLLVGREFAVSGLRSIAAAEGLTIRASDLGKTKMVSQVVGIAALMVGMAEPVWQSPALYWMYAVAVFSLWSAVDYFVQFWRRIDASIKQRRRQELLRLEGDRARQVLKG